MNGRQSGASLPLVLIMLAILSGMATSVLSSARQELRMSRAYLHSSQAFYAAMAGVQWVAARCESSAADCTPPENPPDWLEKSQSAYEVTIVPCDAGTGNCPGVNAGADADDDEAPAFLVTSVGCTGITTVMSHPCQQVKLDQGRRVLQAYIKVQTNDGNRKVTLQLLP